MKPMKPMKPMHVKAIVAAVVLIAAVVISGMSKRWHEGRMVEGFRADAHGSGGIAAADSADFVIEKREGRAVNRREGGAVNRREGFAQLPRPSKQIHERKTQRYLSAGFAQFYSSNSAAARAASLADYLLFFHPTSADLKCDFSKLAPGRSCRSPIDAISTPDRVSLLPPGLTRDSDMVLATATQPVQSVDSQVYILSGVYNMMKTTVRTRAYIFRVPGSKLMLCLPRGDLATRAIMLMRPLYIRSGGIDGALYYIDWTAPGTDGMSYDSHLGSVNATLRIALVGDPNIDESVMPIEMDVNMTDVKPGSDAAFQAPETPSPTGDGVPPPPRSAPSTYPIGMNATSALVLYYMRYARPNPAIVADEDGASVATIVVESRPGATATVKDVSGAAVLTVQCGAATAAAVQVTAQGATSDPLTAPSFGRGCVIASRSYDRMIVVCVDETRTSVRTMQVGGGVLKYKPATALAPLVAGGKLAPYNSQSLPNMADVAALLGYLNSDPISFSDASDMAIAGISAGGAKVDPNRPDSSIVNGGQALLPGQALTSGDFTAVFQADCNFVIYNTKTAMPIWSTGTRMKDVTGGTLEVDAIEGIVRMFLAGKADGGRERAPPYWASTRMPSPRDQGPFSLILTPNGQLRISGTYGVYPAWISGPGVTGFARMRTCAEASVAYAVAHAQEMASSGYGMTPWSHYDQVGRLSGWEWPGPDGPC
jgi:hypothetical protein